MGDVKTDMYLGQAGVTWHHVIPGLIPSVVFAAVSTGLKVTPCITYKFDTSIAEQDKNHKYFFFINKYRSVFCQSRKIKHCEMYVRCGMFGKYVEIKVKC